MRVANCVQGSSAFAIAISQFETTEKRSAVQRGRGRGEAYPCTCLRHPAAPRTGSASVRGGQSTQDVSLKASAPLLHVSRYGDSRLAALHEREESLLALPAR